MAVDRPTRLEQYSRPIGNGLRILYVDVIRVTRSLSAAELEEAYRAGSFPMAAPEFGLITWHRPARRAVIPLDDFHVSRSLARTLRKADFEITVNRDFRGVMEGCAERESTWIDSEIKRVYTELHQLGKAHSLEVWKDGALVGGIYGVHLGAAFFAESKFHRVRDMSKVALAHLVWRLRERGFRLLEVQYLTPHLAQFGTIEVSAKEYSRLLSEALALERRFV